MYSYWATVEILFAIIMIFFMDFQKTDNSCEWNYAFMR